MCKNLAWDSVDHIKVLSAGDLKVCLCHYPMREWPHWWAGGIMLHGHTHSQIPSSSRSWDVGVDNQGFVPLTLAEIRERMAKLPDLDFHGTPIANGTS